MFERYYLIVILNVRILFYESNEWKDICYDVTNTLIGVLILFDEHEKRRREIIFFNFFRWCSKIK